MVVVVHSSIGRKIELKIVAPRRRRGGGSDQGHIPSRKPELLHFEKKKVLMETRSKAWDPKPFSLCTRGNTAETQDVNELLR